MLQQHSTYKIFLNDLFRRYSIFELVNTRFNSLTIDIPVFNYITNQKDADSMLLSILGSQFSNNKVNCYLNAVLML